MKHPLARLSQIPETGTLVVPFFGRELHLYRQGGQLRAAADVCLHFGGPLECRGDRLVCPWHGAAFALDDGRRLQGPAPAGSRLMFLSTRVEDGTLFYVWGE